MIILKGSNENRNGSFKIGFSRGTPTHKVPKLFTNKKTEEFFVTSLYAQLLLQNQAPIIGIEVCEDDSDKGADTIIKFLNNDFIGIQVTRFTLTDFLARKKIALKRVDKLIDEVVKLTNVRFPINIIVNVFKPDPTFLSKPKNQKILENEIVTAINCKLNELSTTDKFLNYSVTNEKLKHFSPVISLQRIPKDFYSNFYGKDNIYIDLDFDNVSFNKSDIEAECLNIYNKKDNGKAEKLIIWADTFEILYEPKVIVDSLKKQFENSTFNEVIFFNFHNNINLYADFKINTEKIK